MSGQTFQKDEYNDQANHMTKLHDSNQIVEGIISKCEVR